MSWINHITPCTRVSTTSNQATRLTNLSDQELGFGMDGTPRCNFQGRKHPQLGFFTLIHQDGLSILIVALQITWLDPYANPSSLLSINNLKPLN